MIPGDTRHSLRTSVLLTISLAVFLATAVGVVEDGNQFLPATVVAAQAQPDTYRNVYDGWKWWHVYCYRCHGTDAIGTANAPNLSDPNSKLSQAEFHKIVSKGIPDKGMQAWDKLLDDKQIDQIHLYVQARRDKVLPPGRPDEVGPNKGQWVPPNGWPRR
ncbi:MAG TPA: cytochrome c [Thermomicrobiales bacterium]|nr:cytochrome c [Thermomicrobiales bacterium]